MVRGCDIKVPIQQAVEHILVSQCEDALIVGQILDDLCVVERLSRILQIEQHHPGIDVSGFRRHFQLPALLGEILRAGGFVRDIQLSVKILLIKVKQGACHDDVPVEPQDLFHILVEETVGKQSVIGLSRKTGRDLNSVQKGILNLAEMKNHPLSILQLPHAIN